MPNSIVREVVVSAENRVTGVRYLDRDSKAEGEVRGACRGRVPARASRAWRCLHDVEIAALSQRPRQLQRTARPQLHSALHRRRAVLSDDLIGKPTTNDEGFLDHAYVPSFMHTRKRDYARSFGAQFNYQNRRRWAGRARCRASARIQDSRSRSLSRVSDVLAVRRNDCPDRRNLHRPGPRTTRTNAGLPVARRHVVLDRQRPEDLRATCSAGPWTF